MTVKPIVIETKPTLKELGDKLGKFAILEGEDHLLSSYSKNEVLYIKEPFMIDTNNNTSFQYLNQNEDTKFKSGVYLKAKQARYFVKVVDITLHR